MDNLCDHRYWINYVYLFVLCIVKRNGFRMDRSPLLIGMNLVLPTFIFYSYFQTGISCGSGVVTYKSQCIYVAMHRFHAEITIYTV